MPVASCRRCVQTGWGADGQGWPPRSTQLQGLVDAFEEHQRKRTQLLKEGQMRWDLMDDACGARISTAQQAVATLEQLVFRYRAEPSEGAWGIVVNPPGTPQQMNGVDCGVCAAQCARTLACTPAGEPPVFTYNGKDVREKLRMVMAFELLNKRLVGRDECIVPANKVTELE